MYRLLPSLNTSRPLEHLRGTSREVSFVLPFLAALELHGRLGPGGTPTRTWGKCLGLVFGVYQLSGGGLLASAQEALAQRFERLVKDRSEERRVGKERRA